MLNLFATKSKTKLKLFKDSYKNFLVKQAILHSLPSFLSKDKVLVNTLVIQINYPNPLKLYIMDVKIKANNNHLLTYCKMHTGNISRHIQQELQAKLKQKYTINLSFKLTF